METEEFPEALSVLRGSVSNNRKGKDPGGSPLTFIYDPWHTSAYTHDLIERGGKLSERQTDRERGESFRSWEKKALVMLKYIFSTSSQGCNQASFTTK